jgi:hypothetical protein
MKRKTFKAQLQTGHKDSALEVPFDPAAVWNAAAKPLWKGRRGFSVKAKVNGIAFESYIVARQNKFFMLVDQSIIKTSGALVGEVVKASVELSTE